MKLMAGVLGLGAVLLTGLHGAAQERDRDVAFFPIGFYELPEEEDALRRMTTSGVNFLRGTGQEELDRIHAAGARAWMPLAVHQGATDSLRAQIESVKDHPALAVWEGPDEIIWTFTAMSTLRESAGITREDWVTQQPHAVAYAEAKAAEIIPAMKEGIALVRALDTRNLPFWMNEARESDAIYVRRYLEDVDVIGCDDYPVRQSGRDVMRVVRATDRWQAMARGKPVWMVLQAFSWHEIGRADTAAWPSFDESRFMAYGCIAHGATGILYWGSAYLTNEACRTSVYALTAELAALEPFLRAPEAPEVGVRLIEAPDYPEQLGVAHLARQARDAWLVALINRDGHPHLGTEVTGLGAIGERPLHLLYGEETVTPDAQGSFITRLQPHQVKVFCTDRSFEAALREGRDYAGD